MVRILVLANSFPTVQAPSGAPYLTNRLTRLAARPDVSVRALALVPRYGPATAAVRRRLGLLPNDALRLPDNEAGRCFQEVPCRWRAADVLAGRLGRIPMALVGRAAAGTLAAVGAHASGPSPYDVVHAHGMYTLPAGAVAERVAAALDVPFVVSLHGSDVEQIMPRCAGAYREVLGRAAATIYVSEALRDRAVRMGAPREGSHVIPNGVDLELFGPSMGGVVGGAAGGAAGGPVDGPADESSMVWSVGGSVARPGPGEPPRVLFVGNLLSVKGADRLPDIMRSLRVRLPGASLDVAGDGALRDALEGERVEGVRCHGRVEPARVAELMRAASVLVVPSRAEGWGCVIGEAYASGTPVVGSAVGGIPEALAGFTEPVPVDGGDETAIAAAFAERIAQVVAAPPDPAALTAHVADRDWEAVVDAELAVLTGVAESAGR